MEIYGENERGVLGIEMDSENENCKDGRIQKFLFPLLKRILIIIMIIIIVRSVRPQFNNDKILIVKMIIITQNLSI